MRKLIIGLIAGAVLLAVGVGYVTRPATSGAVVTPANIFWVKALVNNAAHSNILSQSGGITYEGLVDRAVDPGNPNLPRFAFTFRFPRNVSNCAVVSNGEDSDHGGRPQGLAIDGPAANEIGVAGVSNFETYDIIVMC